MKKISISAKKLISAFLALLSFLGNTVLVHAVETKFWDQRRQSSLASHVLVQKLPPRNTARTNNKSVLFHVQDIHSNKEAQESISLIVSNLLKSEKISAVFVEGAFDQLDLSNYQTFSRQSSIYEASHNLLSKNYISGTLFALLNNRNPEIKIIGVDNAAHYDKNIRAYLNSRQLKSLAQKLLENEGTTLQQDLQQTTPQFRNAVENLRQHQDQKDSFQEYLQMLMSYFSPNDRNLIATKNYLETCRLEKKINPEKSKKELLALTQIILPLLNTIERDAWLNSIHQPISWILEKAREKGIATINYPELNRYNNYSIFASKINGDNLFDSITYMESRVFQNAAKTKIEQTWAQRYRNHILQTKLLNFLMTRQEWSEYEKVLNHRSELATFVEFYREAEFREQTMGQIIRKNFIQNPDMNAILITGGFHSRGLSEKLTGLNISKVNLTPTISKTNLGTGSEYLSIFAQTQTPLERIFDDKQLFLSNRFWTRQIKGVLDLSVSALEIDAGGKIPHFVESWIKAVHINSTGIVFDLKNRARVIFELVNHRIVKVSVNRTKEFFESPWPQARIPAIQFYLENYFPKKVAPFLTVVLEELLFGYGSYSLLMHNFHEVSLSGIPTTPLIYFTVFISTLFAYAHSLGRIGIDAKSYYTKTIVISKLILFRTAMSLFWIMAFLSPNLLTIYLALIFSTMFHYYFFGMSIIPNSELEKDMAPPRTRLKVEKNAELSSLKNAIWNELTADSPATSLNDNDYFNWLEPKLGKLFDEKVRTPIWGPFCNAARPDQMNTKMEHFSILTDNILSLFTEIYFTRNPQLKAVVIPIVCGSLVRKELIPTSDIEILLYSLKDPASMSKEETAAIEEFMQHLKNFIYTHLKFRPTVEMLDKEKFELALSKLEKLPRDPQAIIENRDVLTRLIDIGPLSSKVISEHWPDVEHWIDGLFTQTRKIAFARFLITVFNLSFSKDPYWRDNFWAAIHNNEVDLTESLGATRTYHLIGWAQNLLPNEILITNPERVKAKSAFEFLQYLRIHLASSQVLKDTRPEITPLQFVELLRDKSEPSRKIDAALNSRNRQFTADALLMKIENTRQTEGNTFSDKWNRDFNFRSSEIPLAQLTPIGIMNEYFPRAETIALRTRSTLTALLLHLESSQQRSGRVQILDTVVRPSAINDKLHENFPGTFDNNLLSGLKKNGLNTLNYLDEYFEVDIPPYGVTFDYQRGLNSKSTTQSLTLREQIANPFINKPQTAFDYLETIAVLGLSISPDVQMALHEANDSIHQYLQTPNGHTYGLAAFDRIMGAENNISKIPWLLNELKIMGDLFPDWKYSVNIGAGVESAHRYAIDTHVLQAFHFFEEIPSLNYPEELESQQATLQGCFNAVKVRGDLKLARYAVLFHDIGKPNWRHRSHSEIDKVAAYEILPRLLASANLTPEQKRKGSWTIEHDAMFSSSFLPNGAWKVNGKFNEATIVYTNREILLANDWQEQFNSLTSVDRPEFLLERFDLVTLLSYADAAGLQPGLLSSKKIGQMYFLQAVCPYLEKIRNQLKLTTSIDESYWQRWYETSRVEMVKNIMRHRDLERSQSELSQTPFTPLTDEQIVEFFGLVRTVFWLSEKSETIYSAIKAFYSSSEPHIFVHEPKTYDNPYTFFFSANQDRPLLLSDLAGLLTANGWDIQTAEIETGYVAGRNMIFDKFRVAPIHEIDNHFPERLKNLEEDYQALMANKITVEDIFRKRGRFFSGYKIEIQKIEAKFTRNDSNTIQTVGTDFPGYLHIVSLILGKVFNVNIKHADLNNKVRVEDSFDIENIPPALRPKIIDAFEYTSTLAGQKINPTKLVNDLRKRYGFTSTPPSASSLYKKIFGRFFTRYFWSRWFSFMVIFTLSLFSSIQDIKAESSFMASNHQPDAITFKIENSINYLGVEFADGKPQNLLNLINAHVSEENPYELIFISKTEVSDSNNILEKVISPRMKHAILIPENSEVENALHNIDRSSFVQNGTALTVLKSDQENLFNHKQDGTIEINRNKVDQLIEKQLPLTFFDAASSLHVVLPPNGVLNGNSEGKSYWEKAVLYLIGTTFLAIIVDWNTMKKMADRINAQA